MKTLILLPILLFSLQCKAQETFEKIFDLYDRDIANKAIQSPDGGYLIVGYSIRDEGGILLVKTNFKGDTTWTKYHGGNDIGNGNDIIISNDTNIVILGNKTESDQSESAICLLKTDLLGNEIWMKTYEGNGYNWGNSIQQTDDNGFIICGRITPAGEDKPDIYIVKTDENGELEWSRSYGGDQSEEARSIIITDSGNYIACGLTASFGNGYYYDAFLLKVNTEGDSLWLKTYGGENTDVGSSVKQNHDGGFIMAGHTKSYGAGDVDAYLIKTNEHGEELWHKTFGGTYYEICTDIITQPNNGFVITGYGESFGNGEMDGFLMETNPEGDSLWMKLYKGIDNVYLKSVQMTDDGGFVMSGITFKENPGKPSLEVLTDLYLVRTDQYGNTVGINEADIEEDNTQLYPNPNCGEFTITAKNEIKLIEITDIQGRVVYRTNNDNIRSHKAMISIKNTDPGLYFVRLCAKEKQTILKCVIEN